MDEANINRRIPCSSHQHSWQMDVDPPKNGIYGYWSVAIYVPIDPCPLSEKLLNPLVIIPQTLPKKVQLDPYGVYIMFKSSTVSIVQPSAPWWVQWLKVDSSSAQETSPRIWEDLRKLWFFIATFWSIEMSIDFPQISQIFGFKNPGVPQWTVRVVTKHREGAFPGCRSGRGFGAKETYRLNVGWTTGRTFPWRIHVWYIYIYVYIC